MAASLSLRIILCGLIAGFVWTMLSATVLALVGQEFVAAVPGGRLGAPGSLHGLLFGLNLAQAVWGMWLYAVLRDRYRPGWKTVAVTGFAWWVIVSLQSAKWAALVAIPVRDVVAPVAGNLVAIVVAAVAGAWCFERQNPPRTS